jgi:CubicO group peptidase (beta-lactamase class C family)
MRPFWRIWFGLFLVVLIVLVACSDASLDPTSAQTTTPLAAPTQVPTFAVSPTQSTLWPTEDWRFSTPEDQGLDFIILEQMSQDIRANVPEARSLLIVRNGYIVYEDYFKGDETYAGPIWSVTKSMISALIGIALDEGDIRGIEDRLFDYLAEYDTEDIDPYFDEITIEHLLTMTAGFGYFQRGASSVPAAFREELVTRPGEEASYSSTSAHLLSAILQESTGSSALEMADDRIFAPLGIPKPIWSADGYGTSMGGYGLYLTPRDMAKFGYLYLNDGRWDGRQIIPAAWIETSTSRQAEAGIPELFGFADYGYLWWVHPIGDYQAFAAFGAGGQMILVVPEAELVAVTSTDSSSTMNLSSRVMETIRQALADE